MAEAIIRGHKVVFDECDRPLFESRKWYVTKLGYVLTSERNDGGKKTSIGFHRLIMGRPDADIDHIDRNPLNNSRANLRACTRAENCRNIPTRKGKSSAYRGVSRSRGKWQVVIRINGRLEYFGHFDDEHEAGRVAAPHFAGIAP